MIYDCFLLFNELDLLELRLATLSPVVDRFVLVEMTTTYAGNPKPLYYRDNAERYVEWAHKITHVIVDDAPTGEGLSWQREYHQRNAIARGLAGAAPDDIILISDVDEIPKPGKVAQLAGRLDAQTCILWDQDFYYYTFNHRVLQPWFGTRAVRGAALEGRTPQDVRYLGKFTEYHGRTVPPMQLGIFYHAGWHFSHFGGAEVIKNKLHNGAHQEVNRPEFTDLEAIKRRVAAGLDLFDRPDMEIRLDLAPALPAYANRSRFAAHFAEVESE